MTNKDLGYVRHLHNGCEACKQTDCVGCLGKPHGFQETQNGLHLANLTERSEVANSSKHLKASNASNKSILNYKLTKY